MITFTEAAMRWCANIERERAAVARHFHHKISE